MLSSCFFREGVTSQQPFAWENNTMNITVADGEVQQYDNLADFSPVDSSSVWEVCAGTEDFGTVDFSTAIKDEFIDSCPNGPSFGEDNSSPLPWGFSVQPVPTLKSSNKCSIRDNVLREVMVSEETLQSAVARLGGGAQGLKVLMDHVPYWASESHDADVAATIRKGIVDRGNMPANCGGVNANVQWKYYGNRGSTICEPTNRGAAYTRALRKSHMVRQWRHSPRAQRGLNKSQWEHQSRAQWRTGAHQSWLQDLDPELGNANGKGLEFLFQKVLRASDVSSLGRIILPKKDAERHLPLLYEKEGMMITLEDYHSGTFWTVRYRFWPNHKSRMYLLETIGGFVNYHCLQEGDFLICYRNRQGGYVIRGQKMPPNVKASAKGLSPKSTQGRETTETTETKTLNRTSMSPKHQFLDGDQSTPGTTDSNSDLASSSFESLESTFRGLSDGPKGFEDGYGRQESCMAQQIDYRYNNCKDEVSKTDGFVPTSPKALASHDSGYDPVVEMLAIQRC